MVPYAPVIADSLRGGRCRSGLPGFQGKFQKVACHPLGGMASDTVGLFEVIAQNDLYPFSLHSRYVAFDLAGTLLGIVGS